MINTSNPELYLDLLEVLEKHNADIIIHNYDGLALEYEGKTIHDCFSVRRTPLKEALKEQAKLISNKPLMDAIGQIVDLNNDFHGDRWAFSVCDEKQVVSFRVFDRMNNGRYGDDRLCEAFTANDVSIQPFEIAYQALVEEEDAIGMIRNIIEKALIQNGYTVGR